MDDGGKPPHSFGSGQQRTQHSRPFFYVQPPSQPYYMYHHWHLNNPYNQYALPAGYNFGRPYAPSYPYMQYPGYLFPHAHLYQAEYRQMYEPRFHQFSGNEMFRHHHYHHPHSHGQRDMLCPEMQTDPSDVINKVIEQLTKLQPSELAAMRELDSGVTSHASGIYSPVDGSKGAEQSAVHSPPCAALEHGCTPATVLSDPATAVYDRASGRSLGDLNCDGHWLVASDEEPPLGSSSIHEDCTNAQQSAVDEDLFLQHCPLEKTSLPALQQLENSVTEVADHQSDDDSTNENIPRSTIEEPAQNLHAIMPSEQSVIPHPTSTQKVLEDTENGDVAPKIEPQETESPDKVEVDLPYQILKLPFEKALTTIPLHKGRSIFCGEQSATYKSSHLSSPVHPYYYNYLTSQTSHERMSVLSPSLDELSSRDELFSTDLDDMDLFPTHVYASRRLAEVSSRSSKMGDGVEEVWPVCSKKFICACCGKGLAKGTSRSKTLSQAALLEDDWDEEFKCCTHPARVVVKKHSAPRRLHPPFLRHRLKHSYKRGEDCLNSVDQQVAKEQCVGEGDAVGDHLHCRTCQDGLCRDDLTTSDQGRWEGSDVKPRRSQKSLQRQERTMRKAACNPLVYHRARDEENDEDESLSPQHHREMASGNRGPRY